MSEIGLFCVVLLSASPAMYLFPQEAQQYLHLLRREDEFVAWWRSHRAAKNPLIEFSQDCSGSRRNRKRAWQAGRKFGRFFRRE